MAGGSGLSWLFAVLLLVLVWEASAWQRPQTDPDYYRMLGVAEDATLVEIKKAYRKQAKVCHPDLNPGDESMNQKFQEIVKAYEVLSDEGLRRAYNRRGLRGVHRKNTQRKVVKTVVKFFSKTFSIGNFFKLNIKFNVYTT